MGANQRQYETRLARAATFSSPPAFF